MIGIRGSRERKAHASYLLFFYTIVSSFPMLIGIFILYQQTGSTHYEVLYYVNVSNTSEHLL